MRSVVFMPQEHNTKVKFVLLKVQAQSFVESTDRQKLDKNRTYWGHLRGGYLESFRWRERRCKPRSLAACETLPPQSVRTRWMCSHSTRARLGTVVGRRVCLSTNPQGQSTVPAERRRTSASKRLLPGAARLTPSSGTIPADLKSWRHSMVCASLYAWIHFQVKYRT